MDICDDWEPTEKMLELNDIAKEKNLLALLGLGASPGITNLLGRIAIDNLDIAHTIYTGWNLELGTRYAFIKSARTHTLVTGMADLRLNADPGFPALRPQLAAGKRFFLPNDFFIDAQAQLGTDLIFYNGAEPRLVGGFNVTFAPSDTIRLFLEGNIYMKDFSFDQGPFAFNTVGFGMKIMDKKCLE